MELIPESSYLPTSSQKPSASSNYPSPAPSEDNCLLPQMSTFNTEALYDCKPADIHSFHGLIASCNSPGLAPGWAAASSHQSRADIKVPSDPAKDSFTASFSDMLSYTSSPYIPPRAPSSALSSSPALSSIDSSRSSVSSFASELFSLADNYHVYQPHIKMEEQLDWPSGSISMLGLHGNENFLQDNQTMNAPLPTFPNHLEASFFPLHNPIVWDNPAQFNDNTSFVDPAGGSSMNSPARWSSEQQRRTSRSSTARTKAPRKMTTQEDANFQCDVKGCGKLFSRSYNYKSHLETHSNTREYPFPCAMSGCRKKFVRKTDLQRHHASVHEKTRNHQCDFCSRSFARKDTLRRHMEDGCSKRFSVDMPFTSPGMSGKSEDPKPQEKQHAQSPFAAGEQSPYVQRQSSSLQAYPTTYSNAGGYINSQESMWTA